MSASSKANYKPKAIDIERIGLYNYRSVFLDLDQYNTVFRIYEDIFTNTMTCSLKILDAVSLIETFPIIGEELIEIEFSTPTFDENIRCLFDVYKISDREKQGEKADSYTLFGVSREHIRSMNRTVDRAYTGYSIGDIVKLVYENVLKDKQKGKEIAIEPTLGLHSFIAPENAPFEFINLLSSEAQSATNRQLSNYVFYEDHDQFNFKTIAGMFDQEPVEDFYYIQQDVEEEVTLDEGDKISPDQRVESIEYLNQFDMLSQTDNGLLDNSSLILDLIFKETEERTFIYDKDFSKLKSLGGNKIISSVNSAVDSVGASHSRYFLSNLSLGNYHQKSYLNRRCPPIDPTNFYPFVRHKFVASTIAHSASINNIMMHISVPGNSKIKAGQIINLYVPTNASDQETKDTYNKFFGNKYSSAKFLVVRVEHVYNKAAGYFTIMKVAKDAYAEPALTELDDQGVPR
jgi:hypothetical protein